MTELIQILVIRIVLDLIDIFLEFRLTTCLACVWYYTGTGKPIALFSHCLVVSALQSLLVYAGLRLLVYCTQQNSELYHRSTHFKMVLVFGF